ncbi:MAG: hypothetical protein ACREAA_17215 [Candidatus Polarisedimenticolia bacterium]
MILRTVMVAVALVPTGMVVSSNATPPTPSVRLEAPQKASSPTGPVMVRFTLENETDSTVFLYRRFFPPKVAEGPDTVLSFTILGPDNWPVTPGEPAIPPGLYAREWYCDFLEMPPGDFVGRRIDLTGPLFRYEFGKPGTYRVRANLTFGARRWLEKKAELEGTSLSKEYQVLLVSRSLFYEGTVESNEIQIEVR